MSCIRRLLAPASVAVSLLLVPALKATPLLTAAYEAQLEAWLGQGDLIFSNVFTKQAGDNSGDFHAAADGQGATFTLMSISGRGSNGTFDLPGQVIGGYNPQSWSSNGSYNMTPSDSERTAFLYNLSAGTIQRQNLNGEGLSGLMQTYNGAGAGPVFGGLTDLNVYGDLDGGHAQNFFYGGTSNGDEIVFGGANHGSDANFDVGALEVWIFTPATSAVPDTSDTLGLLSITLLALAAIRHWVA